MLTSRPIRKAERNERNGQSRETTSQSRTQFNLTADGTVQPCWFAFNCMQNHRRAVQLIVAVSP